MPARPLLLHDPVFLEHDTGPGHVERPDRLRAIDAELARQGLLDRFDRVDPRPATDDELLRLHTPAYLDRLADACRRGLGYIDTPDSAICPETERVARLAAGGCLELAERLARGDAERALGLVRPPGHHAEADRSMGFCLYANAALTADHLARRLGKSAVVDFDLHHGNGTQHLLEDRADVLVVNLHEDPAVQYPGTGFAHETGRGAGEGFTLNLPMPPGTDDRAWLGAFDRVAAPALERFAPEALVISAGFDAAVRDPLGHLEITTDGFAAMADRLVSLGERLAEAHGRRCPVLAVLEGGYDLGALGQGVAALAERLCGPVSPGG
ncbi:MAG: histone deacetylase [Planctomycetota bacterium]